MRYTNKIVIFITDDTDRASTCIQAQGVTHDTNNFGEQQEGAEYNVSVLMGDRTQATLFEILARNIIEFINTPEQGYTGEKPKPTEDDIDNFDYIPGNQEASLKYNNLVLFVGLKLNKAAAKSETASEFASKKSKVNQSDVQYLNHLSWIISQSYRDVFK